MARPAPDQETLKVFDARTFTKVQMI